MFNQVQTLTTFEMMHTYGFLKIMSMIWSPVIIVIALYLVYKKQRRKYEKN